MIFLPTVDLTNKFDPVYIKSKWYPNASFARNARLPTVIKPSSEWDDDHLYAFNLHYLRVEKEEDWKVYICPPANLTHDAIALSSYKHGPNAFKAGTLSLFLFLSSVSSRLRVSLAT